MGVSSRRKHDRRDRHFGKPLDLRIRNLMGLNGIKWRRSRHSRNMYDLFYQDMWHVNMVSREADVHTSLEWIRDFILNEGRVTSPDQLPSHDTYD